MSRKKTDMNMTNMKNYNCINLCWECRTTCLDTLTNYCLFVGGDHAGPSHVIIMMDCIDMCQLTADFMKRNSYMHTEVCSVCADVCEACAASCERIKDAKLQRCAEICRLCARSCREVSVLRYAA